MRRRIPRPAMESGNFRVVCNQPYCERWTNVSPEQIKKAIFVSGELALVIAEVQVAPSCPRQNCTDGYWQNQTTDETELRWLEENLRPGQRQYDSSDEVIHIQRFKKDGYYGKDQP